MYTIHFRFVELNPYSLCSFNVFWRKFSFSFSKICFLFSRKIIKNLGNSLKVKESVNLQEQEEDAAMDECHIQYNAT